MSTNTEETTPKRAVDSSLPIAVLAQQARELIKALRKAEEDSAYHAAEYDKSRQREIALRADHKALEDAIKTLRLQEGQR